MREQLYAAENRKDDRESLLESKEIAYTAHYYDPAIHSAQVWPRRYTSLPSDFKTLWRCGAGKVVPLIAIVPETTN
jgi:hypothetical protein